MQANRIPSASLTQRRRCTSTSNACWAAFQKVEIVFSKTGTAESNRSDAANLTDAFIMLSRAQDPPSPGLDKAALSKKWKHGWRNCRATPTVLAADSTGLSTDCSPLCAWATSP